MGFALESCEGVSRIFNLTIAGLSSVMADLSGRHPVLVSFVQQAKVSFYLDLPHFVSDEQLASSIEQAACDADESCTATVELDVPSTLRNVTVTEQIAEVTGRRRLAKEGLAVSANSTELNAFLEEVETQLQIATGTAVNAVLCSTCEVNIKYTTAVRVAFDALPSDSTQLFGSITSARVASYMTDALGVCVHCGPVTINSPPFPPPYMPPIYPPPSAPPCPPSSPSLSLPIPLLHYPSAPPLQPSDSNLTGASVMDVATVAAVATTSIVWSWLWCCFFCCFFCLCRRRRKKQKPAHLREDVDAQRLVTVNEMQQVKCLCVEPFLFSVCTCLTLPNAFFDGRTILCVCLILSRRVRSSLFTTSHGRRTSHQGCMRWSWSLMTRWEAWFPFALWK